MRARKRGERVGVSVASRGETRHLLRRRCIKGLGTGVLLPCGGGVGGRGVGRVGGWKKRTGGGGGVFVLAEWERAHENPARKISHRPRSFFERNGSKNNATKTQSPSSHALSLCSRVCLCVRLRLLLLRAERSHARAAGGAGRRAQASALPDRGRARRARRAGGRGGQGRTPRPTTPHLARGKPLAQPITLTTRTRGRSLRTHPHSKAPSTKKKKQKQARGAGRRTLSLTGTLAHPSFSSCAARHLPARALSPRPRTGWGDFCRSTKCV